MARQAIRPWSVAVARGCCFREPSPAPCGRERVRRCLRLRQFFASAFCASANLCGSRPAFAATLRATRSLSPAIDTGGVDPANGMRVMAHERSSSVGGNEARAAAMAAYSEARIDVDEKENSLHPARPPVARLSVVS